jgi:putative pyruvate formate lyase activating enzyme
VVCHTGERALVHGYGPHHGEEDPLRGSRGSGTIFFTWCNLRCEFCQNWEISQKGEGREVSPEELAAIMLELQSLGCHNINLVSPSHVVAQIIAAVAVAAARGLRLPLVYNTGGYDSPEALALLDGIVDIYMPDMKYFDEPSAKELSDAVGYIPNAQAALAEMWRQVGPLDLREDGVARRGLLVRHLVLPNRLSQSVEVLRFLASALGKTASVSLLAQYFPRHRAVGHPLLSRPLHEGEYARVVDALEKEGLEEGYIQELKSASHYLPDFLAEGHPFERE